MSYYINDSMGQLNNYGYEEPDDDNDEEEEEEDIKEDFDFGKEKIRFYVIAIIFIIGLILVFYNLKDKKIFYKYEGLIIIGAGVLGIIYNMYVGKKFNFNFGKKAKAFINGKRNKNKELQEVATTADFDLFPPEDTATISTAAMTPQYKI